MRIPATVPTPLDAERPLRRRQPLLALALVGAGAVAGATMLLGSTTEERGLAPLPRPAVASAGPAEVGDRVSTSFGSMSLDAAVRLIGQTGTGLTLPRGELPLQVSVTFVNTSERPLRNGPNLLRLVPAGGGPAIDPGAGDLGPTRMGALSAHRYVLQYAIPARGALPRLQFTDRGERTTFSLGDRRSLPGFDPAGHSPLHNVEGYR